MPRARAGFLLAPALLLAGCTAAGGPAPSTQPTSARAPHVTSEAPAPALTGAPSRPATAPATARADRARQVLDAMSLRRRVGQLLMVDCPTSGPTSATTDAITRYDAGSVILDGTSYAGVAATTRLTAGLRALAGSTGLLIATDQEGGEVQRLQGSGFSLVPPATVQGELAPAVLRTDARRWGTELRSAGVDVDLAPVLDTVPAGGGPNPPIGDLDREFGHTPQTVAAHGTAVVRGLADAGILATAKHFPGLGRVTANTDTTGGVTDALTTATDPYLAPFRAAVGAGVPVVMISTAIYSGLDPNVPATFSRRIVTDLLRVRLGFRGVVISDDLGAAAQVAGYSPGQRAVRFVAAGGDLVLTVVAGQAAQMSAALLARAKADPAFRVLVDAAALRVLQAKLAHGVLR